MCVCLLLYSLKPAGKYKLVHLAEIDQTGLETPKRRRNKKDAIAAAAALMGKKECKLFRYSSAQ